MNTYIKSLINVNRDANKNIEMLEKAIINMPVNNDKEKANFGNCCVALRGFRMVSEATEAMLENENIVLGEDGAFYEKVDETVRVPNTSGKGSDLDIDSNNKKNE